MKPRGYILAFLLFGLLTTASCDTTADEFVPTVTADQVTDRATLKTFVQEAAKGYLEGLKTQSPEQVEQMFREDGGYWRKGDIYIWIASREGVILFHAANKSLEGQNLYEYVDLDGVKYMQELIKAADAGGGYVEYLFDNPLVDGDEESGSPKVGYTELITVSYLNNGQPSVIGSGIYP